MDSILVILDLEVIESLGVHDKIGDPVVLEPRAAETTIAGNDFYGAK